MTGYKPLQRMVTSKEQTLVLYAEYKIVCVVGSVFWHVTMFRCTEDDNYAKANVAGWLTNLLLWDCKYILNVLCPERGKKKKRKKS